MTPHEQTESESTGTALEETFNWHRIRRLQRKG